LLVPASAGLPRVFFCVGLLTKYPTAKGRCGRTVRGLWPLGLPYTLLLPALGLPYIPSGTSRRGDAMRRLCSSLPAPACPVCFLRGSPYEVPHRQRQVWAYRAKLLTVRSPDLLDPDAFLFPPSSNSHTSSNLGAGNPLSQCIHSHFTHSQCA